MTCFTSAICIYVRHFRAKSVLWQQISCLPYTLTTGQQKERPHMTCWALEGLKNNPAQKHSAALTIREKEFLWRQSVLGQRQNVIWMAVRQVNKYSLICQSRPGPVYEASTSVAGTIFAQTEKRRRKGGNKITVSLLNRVDRNEVTATTVLYTSDFKRP